MSMRTSPWNSCASQFIPVRAPWRNSAASRSPARHQASQQPLSGFWGWWSEPDELRTVRNRLSGLGHHSKDRGPVTTSWFVEDPTEDLGDAWVPPGDLGGPVDIRL